jgi:anti-sigma factor RsiW
VKRVPCCEHGWRTFLDGELLVETAREIVRHVHECDRCRAEIDDRRRVRTAVKAAFERAPSLRPRPEFLGAIGNRVRSVERAPRAGRSWRATMALAATVLLAFGFLAVRHRAAVREYIALATAAVGDHQNCALRFRLGERPVSLEEASLRFDPAYARLAAVSPAAAALPRGPVSVRERHSCVFEGRRFAHIVLSYGGELVSVVVAADSDAAVPDAVRSIDGSRVASFRTSRYAVFVVSPFDEQETARLTAAVEPAVAAALEGA